MAMLFAGQAGASTPSRPVAAATEIAVESADGWSYCTVAAIGTSRRGAIFALTAGHCGAEGDAVYSAHGEQVGDRVGEVRRVVAIDDGDLGVIALDVGTTYTDSVDLNGEGPLPIVGVLSPEELNQVQSPQICSRGATSGYRCGALNGHASDDRVQVSAPSAPGDSGAGLFLRTESGLYLVGVHVARDGLGTPVSDQLDKWGLDVRTAAGS
ncbi:hypothetical protein [Gordonia malaquae]|uniref:hypothetical protein n=1 Tax=Gordonia malaquae TaxID=410332 RepID=UPI003AFB711D